MRNSNLISCMVVVLVAYFGRADAAVWNDFRGNFCIFTVVVFRKLCSDSLIFRNHQIEIKFINF